ncbi:MAG TPA: hypothetical protein VH853_00355 [Polyangia bacterium]|jgi:hypothetical protein|nr:hypothetical protein [Polyangia bacterium]
MRLTVIMCALLALVATCGRGGAKERGHGPPPDWLIDYVHRTDSELQGVDPSNGIDAREALAIAGVYMVKYVIGCGGPDGAVLQGDTWVVGLRTGVAGRKSDRTIQVDSKSGAVWGLGGPRYHDFQSFRYGVLIEIARDGH